MKGNKQLSPDQTKKLVELTQMIQEKRRIERIEKLRARPQAVVERLTYESPTRERASTLSEEKPMRLKPSYIRLMNEVFCPDCLNEVI